MAAAPIGSCWATDSWEETAWEEDTWADEAPPTPTGWGGFWLDIIFKRRRRAR